MDSEAMSTYLNSEITALELAKLMDDHMHEFVRLVASTGEPWTQEQLSAYHHLRRWRDLLVELSSPQPATAGKPLQP